MTQHLFSDIRIPIEKDNPAIRREENLCIQCGQCRQVCEREIGVGRLYDLNSTEDRAICIHCGQCANVCPVNSITEVPEYPQVRKAIADPDKIVIFSTSPSVRVALGDAFGLPAGSFVEGSLVAALRALGGDYVLDTNFSADLTIMEEASELVRRIAEKGSGKPLPQFTSCCPAWVKFTETFYPEFLPHLSSAKSPIGMQGPTIKTYFAQKQGLDPDKIVNVAVTPCTAKKFEIRRPEMDGMDYVITTRELAAWMKEEHIDFNALTPSPYDALMGPASGAGILFGNTGGVMEAALRTGYYLITGENPSEDLLQFVPLRGTAQVREATVTIAGLPLRVAVIHGTENARQILKQMKAGSVPYDFIEVMTCRGGCIGGGGQPKVEVPTSDETRSKRMESLYVKDSLSKIRYSHENPDIQRVYSEYYQKPGSPLAEKLLHTHYQDRSGDLGALGMVEKELTEAPGPTPSTQSAAGSTRWKCSICGYIHEGDTLPEDFKCPLCTMPAEVFEPLS